MGPRERDGVQVPGEEVAPMLTVGMIALGLVTFAAMYGFVVFCDRV